MKKLFSILGTLVVIFGLAACGAAPEEMVESVSGGIETVAQVTPSIQADGQGFDTNISKATKLMIGIVKLEDTQNPLTSEQAAEMLPLWKALRSLVESETTAAVELDALVDQIEDLLTTDQLEEIEAMQIQGEDIRIVGEELGVEFGGGGRFGDMTPEMQATIEAARESGQMPEGGFGRGLGGGIPGQGGGPGGGQGLGGAEGLSPEAQQTAVAERDARRGANLGLNSAFLDGIIDFLESKVE